MTHYPGDSQWSPLGLEPSRLPGTGRIADDLYLIAHHEITGKPYLSKRATGTAMAAGLLAELMATEIPAIALDRGGILLHYRSNGGSGSRYVRPGEPATAYVLDQIMAEPVPRPVRDWLQYLGKSSVAQVAVRLERAGYVTRAATRIPWLAGRPVPVESDSPRCALLRAHAVLDETRPLTRYSALLYGVTVACGLGFRFSELSKPATRSAEDATRMLTRPLHRLIAHVQLAADAAVLSNRM
jgi:hypothetical protein